MRLRLDFLLDGVPDVGREFGALLLDDCGAEEGAVVGAVCEFALSRPAVEEAGGPEITGSGGVDNFFGGYGFGVEEAVSGSDPGTACANFDGGDRAERGEFTSHGGVVVAQSGVGGGFFFVGEDDVNVVAEDSGKGFAGGLDDFEGGEVEADRATGLFGRMENRLKERLVKE